MSEYPKFSDFSEEQGPLEGEKLKIVDVLNKEILITAFDIKASKYKKNKTGKYLTLQFKVDENGEPNVLFTGSDVLIEQTERYEEQIPFFTTIVKIDQYFTFS